MSVNQLVSHSLARPVKRQSINESIETAIRLSHSTSQSASEAVCQLVNKDWMAFLVFVSCEQVSYVKVSWFPRICIRNTQHAEYGNHHNDLNVVLPISLFVMELERFTEKENKQVINIILTPKKKADNTCDRLFTSEEALIAELGIL